MGFTVSVLTVSDRCSRGEEQDRSGPYIARWMTDNLGATVVQMAIVPDEREQIAARLIEWSDQGEDRPR